MRTSWTDEENDLIVADYFAMLDASLRNRQYSKTEHRRRLHERIGRSEPSIEFKHRNISAVVHEHLGLSWLEGYRPADNYQKSLVDAVERWLEQGPRRFDEMPQPPLPEDVGTGELTIGEPPSLGNRRPSPAAMSGRMLGRKWGSAGRDERNRILGRKGEERVLNHERAVLQRHGLPDLARKVRWVSEEDGDGAGYDIRSFTPAGRARLIEVKTTCGGHRTPFYISRNELAVADERREDWRLMRVWDFAREPQAFELSPPLERHVELTVTSYRANFL